MSFQPLGATLRTLKRCCSRGEDRFHGENLERIFPCCDWVVSGGSLFLLMQRRWCWFCKLFRVATPPLQYPSSSPPSCCLEEEEVEAAEDEAGVSESESWLSRSAFSSSLSWSLRRDGLGLDSGVSSWWVSSGSSGIFEGSGITLWTVRGFGSGGYSGALEPRGAGTGTDGLLLFCWLSMPVLSGLSSEGLCGSWDSLRSGSWSSCSVGVGHSFDSSKSGSTDILYEPFRLTETCGGGDAISTTSPFCFFSLSSFSLWLFSTWF